MYLVQWQRLPVVPESFLWMWISWITAGSEEDICLLNYQCYSLYTSSIVVPLVRQMHQMKIAEITSQTSVSEDIDVYLRPETIQQRVAVTNSAFSPFWTGCMYFLMRHPAPFELQW